DFQDYIRLYCGTMVSSKNGRTALQQSVSVTRIDEIYGPESAMKGKAFIWRPNPGLVDYGIDWKTFNPISVGTVGPYAKYDIKTTKGTPINLYKRTAPAAPDWKYNCHSYSVRAGGPGNICFAGSGPFWVDNPDMAIILKDGYKKIGKDFRDAKTGDLVVWEKD